MPTASRVKPEFHEHPDMEKLIFALLAIAEKLADEDRAANDKGDTMT